MPHNSRINELLEEILNSDDSPEDICATSPELLSEVLNRLRKVRALEDRIERIFPSTDDAMRSTFARVVDTGNDPPIIPGYEVESVLGRGGMGVVYRAKQLNLNRFVALKMLLAGSNASTTELLRFSREAEAIAGLRHPNIVQIYDVGDVGGQPYFTMELVEGGNLADRIGGKAQPVCDAAETLVVLARAVQSAHDSGIVHRDLKPANVLLTLDGLPKIGDFGLARFIDAEGGLTLSGTRLGTPNYMAPEQVAGHATGPSVDIHALGTLLYEMLTGQPPFRGEVISDMERRLVSEEPQPPSQLNSKVPRDLETICLKCLQKQPRLRYATAGELAKDLKRFLGNEPILARPVSRIEHLWRWTSRNQTRVALLCTGLTLCGFFVTEAVQISAYAATRRIEKNRLIGRLESGLQLVQQNRIEAARAILERLGDGGFEDVHQRIEQAKTDLDFIETLDAIRLNRLTSGDLIFYKTKAARDYKIAFQNAGLIGKKDSSFDVAKRIQDSIIKRDLITAIDDWAFCASDIENRKWLLDISLQADPDPSGWRDRIRNPENWEDVPTIAALTQSVPIKGDSVALLLTLGELLRIQGGDATGFLKRVQQENPDNFWSNLTLGDALLMPAPEQAEAFYRAALAIRPYASVGYTTVGDSLRFQQQPKQAIDYYQKALKLNPFNARAQTNIGNAWNDLGNIEKAIECYRAALQLDPNYAWADYDLGNALKRAGKLDEALEHFQISRQAQPENTTFQHGARSVLVMMGRGKEAALDWKRMLAGGTYEYADWTGYAELCLFVGDKEEYQRVCNVLLEKFGDTKIAGTAEGIARCCSLLPASDDRVLRATSLADVAFNSEAAKSFWYYRYYVFAKGLNEFRLGNIDSANAKMENDAAKAMGPCPQLISAMVEHQKGNNAEARRLLALAITSFDWSAEKADGRDHWINHILRREAESLILPNMARYLSGEHSPENNDERLSYVGVCQFDKRDGACTKLYADAFVNDPKLLNTLAFQAACTAAVASCGRSADSHEFNQTDRSCMLTQAVEWLKFELNNMSKNPDRSIASVRSYFVQQLLRWKTDQKLSGVRDAGELKKLTKVEREQCLALWMSVDAEIKLLQNWD